MAHLDRFLELKSLTEQHYRVTYPDLALTPLERSTVASMGALNAIGINADESVASEVIRRAALIHDSSAWRTAEAKVVASL